MLERLTRRTMTLTAGVLCAAGIVEGIRTDSWSVAILFGLVMLVGAGIAKDRAAQRPIRVRPDLREWLDDTASVTGDTIEELANSALSAYSTALSRPGND